MGIAELCERQVQWVNPRWAEILGARPEHLAGADLSAFCQDPGTFERLHREADAELGRGRSFRGDFRMRRVDGTPFWGHLVAVRLPQASGHEGDIWCLDDVSSQIETREELEDALALQDKLIASSPSGILLFRAADGSCLLANEAALRILGIPAQQRGQVNFRRAPDWASSGLLAEAEAALAGGLDRTVETAVAVGPGREATLACSFSPFESRGERLLLVLVSDVSERVQAAEALRETREQFRAVVEALTEGLVILGPGEAFIYSNGRVAEMLGCSREEILGEHWSTVLAPEDQAMASARRNARPEGAADSYEVRLRRKDGEFLEALLSITSIRDARGRVVAVPVLVTDITVRKRSERERERLLAELEQKNKELETLVYVASHDLRSPLVNIQGFSQRLGRSLEQLQRLLDAGGPAQELRAAAAPLLGERMPAALEYIRASGAKMDAIINGLLRLSRAGRMVLRAEVLDMDRLLQSVLAAMAFQIQEAEGEVALEALPGCRADPVQTAQVFSNLLDNAVKYRRPGQAPRIRVSARLEAGQPLYCIEDNGIGIAVEHRGRIFDIFQRLDPQGATKGDGLGLTLVRRMVERNGGRIWMESAPGGGSRFFVALPAV
jgi:PAS domain S-box-containing protein